VTDLRRVLWIGGGTGGGKSSTAIALAEEHGLERYSYGWHDSRDHTERTPADRHPKRAAFLAMSMDERWVTRSPEQMVDETIASFRERFVGPVIADPRHAIFLLPTPPFREWALAQRGWVTIEGTSDPARARANRLVRDEILTNHVRRSAAALGLRVIEIDGSRSLNDVIAAAEEHLFS
jgi:hypothetical protein